MPYLRNEVCIMNIRYIKDTDKAFWFRLDEHIAESEFEKKVRDKMGYVLSVNEVPVGILRYNLFWDNIPFCTMLFIDSEYQHKGYGKELMNFWQKEMKQIGYGILMTSTQVDEAAQHFYRKIGFHDAGSLIIDIPKYKQPMEMFFIKEL